MTTFTTDDRLNTESNTKDQVSKHTKGPWVADLDSYPIMVRSATEKWPLVDELGNKEGEDGAFICNTGGSKANAKHIVACVNACEGLPDGCLDGGWTALGASQHARKLEVINAELLEALIVTRKALEVATTPLPADRQEVLAAMRLAGTVIAKARGEQV